MNRKLLVRDKHGAVVERVDGVLQDGDVVRHPFHLMDGRTTVAVRDSAARILGDAYVLADYAGLSDEAVRHAVVRKRLGDAANGRPAPFLDAAWNALAGTPGASPAATAAPSHFDLTEAQRVIAQAGVRAALADAAGGRAAPGVISEKVIMDGQEAAAGVRAVMKDRKANAWKGASRQDSETLFDGCTYEERTAIKSGARAPHKTSVRQVSDAEFYRRQYEYRNRGDAA